MYPRRLVTALFASIAIAACHRDSTPATAGEVTEQLPADRIGQVLALQPGVVASSAPQGVSIRGSRADSKVTYVDGVPTQAANGGGAQGRVIDTASLPSMLIRTGTAAVQVDSLEPAIAALDVLVRRAGGYVGNTWFNGGEERRRSATLQLRFPATRFGDIQAGLSTLGKVQSLNVQVQDVGEEYTDASARLVSKRQEEARMLELLRTRAGKLSDVVELEQALEQVREEIESTEGRLRYLRNQVALSTMTVTLSEPGLQIAEPGSHPIRDAFGIAWQNFTGFVAGLIAAAGWLVPLVVVLTLVVKLAVWSWRKRKSR